MPCQVDIFNVSCDVLAAALSASPTMTLAASIQKWTAPYYLTGLCLNSTLLNFGTTPLGVFVIIGQKAITLSYSSALKSPVCHVTLQNSYTGPPSTPVPTNKSTPISFAQPFPINPDTTIGLYTFGDTTAGNRVNAYLSLQMVQR